MKKVIILLCFVMFISVNAKHYKKYDKNPNATVLVKLNFPDGESNEAGIKYSGITSVDGILFHKWAIIHTSYFHSVKLEPGFHEVTVSHMKYGKYGKTTIKHEFKENQTYIIDVYADKSYIKAKLQDNEETE
ncbi:MAG: hypothetical protein KA080_03780 [Leptotrichiaceae bacterium]|nr:hypothetical protein [Leptotrichiaceae bacterium]